MKKIYILFFIITSYAGTAQILLNGRLIHELPAKSSVDTGDLIIVANPSTGKPYKARKNQVIAGANGVTDGDKGDITVSGSGGVFTIDGSSVQNGKLAMMGNRTYKANLSGTTASPQDATSDQVISDLGINLKMNLTDTASLSNRINAKQNTLVSGSNIKSINGNSLVGSGDVTITSAVAWGNITGSNIMLQTDLRDSFEHTIAAGTTGQYWRGDKTWQTLNKAAVGLSAVDNTADVDKPISNATNAALAGKQAQLVSGTNIKTINFIDLLGSGNITISGGSGGGETLDQTLELGNVSNLGASIATDSAKQFIIGDDTAKTWYATNDLFPKLSIQKLDGYFSNNSPILNIASNTEGGLIWEFNPVNMDSDADVPFAFAYGIARDLQTAGKDDFSYTFGTNLTAGGGRKDSGQPQFLNVIETQYEVSLHGWVLENYTAMTSKDGSSIRPYYFIANRDSLYRSTTNFSSDVIQFQGGKNLNVLGSMSFSAGVVGVSSPNLSLYPGTASSTENVTLAFYGTANYSNRITMLRPDGASGAGTMDQFMRYMVNGTEPVFQIGAENNNSSVGVSGQLGVGLFGGNAAIYAPISYPTIHIGRITSEHGRNTLSVMQINYNNGYFYESNTGIDAYDALRINNTSGKKWSIGADGSKFFLNNTTDAVRVLNIDNDGALSIGNGTTSANASAIVDITSTTKGFLPPRMTKTQRDAISSPATGLVVYQTDNTPGLRCYNGTNWMRYTETAD